MYIFILRYVFYLIGIAAIAVYILRAAHHQDSSWLKQTNGRIGIPNWISIGRIIAAVIATDIYLTQSFGDMSNIYGCVVLGVAILSDAFDGMIARKTGQITKAGKCLDPLSDKVIFYLTFISLLNASHGSFSATIPNANLIIVICATLMVFRDFLVIAWFWLKGRHDKTGVGAGLSDKLRTVCLSIWLAAGALTLCINDAILGNLALISFIIAGVLSPITIVEDYQRLKSR